MARSDGNDGALAAELGKLNEEHGEVHNRLEEVGHTMEALGAGGPTEDDVRNALQKLDPLWDELFPAEKERIVKLLVGEVVIRFDGRPVKYDFNELDELHLSYATTVHKSQGSEYPVVVLPIHTQHYMMLQRNLLYTAITRSRKLVVLVGTLKALAIAVKNMDARRRVRLLKQRLQASLAPGSLSL